MKIIRTLLADDHAIFLDGLEQIAKTIEGLEVIGRVTNGADVIFKLKTQIIDLLILDINLPKSNGVEILDFIQNNKLKVKVIVLTYYNDYALIKKVMALDAMAYVFKDSGRDDIICALQTVINGKKYLSPSVQEVLKIRNEKVDPHDDFVAQYNLTKREIEILTEIAKELSTVEIADKLCLSEYTVETYRKSIIRKLAAKNTASLVNFAHKWKLV